MTEKKNGGMKTGEDFASPGPEALALREKFMGLEESANEMAMLIPPACEPLNKAWDVLLPVLHEMQALLSQRGEKRDLHREAKLPGWEEWWTRFQKKTGLDSTLRNVQLRLRRYRDMDKPLDKVKPERKPAIKLSVDKLMRMLDGLQRASELASAIKEGAYHHDLLRGFLELRIDADYIGRWLESLRGGADKVEFSLASVTPVAAVTEVAAEPPVPTQELVRPSARIQMPMAGDGNGLSRIVSEVCGRQIDAAIQGVDASTAAAVFEMFVNKLVQRHCRYNGIPGGIDVTVTYVRHNAQAVKDALVAEAMSAAHLPGQLINNSTPNQLAN